MQRVIKAVLPDNVQIGKDAKAAFSRSAGIFIMSVLVILVAAWCACCRSNVRSILFEVTGEGSFYETVYARGDHFRLDALTPQSHPYWIRWFCVDGFT